MSIGALLFLFVVLVLFHHLFPDDRADCTADDEADDDALDELLLRFFRETAEEPHTKLFYIKGLCVVIFSLENES